MTPPEIGLPAYNCPHCGAFAQQQWGQLMNREIGLTSQTLFDTERAGAEALRNVSPRIKGNFSYSSGISASQSVNRLRTSRCTACDLSAIWFFSEMIFPAPSSAPPASPDLPAVALVDYDEAARVFPHSPRAAAALLRLSLQNLCGHLLGKPGAKIDNMIADFVALGAPAQVQQAMDILRVTGNNAVHPGTMAEVDDQGTARALFGLINLIVDVLITQPKHIDQMYAGLPAGAREAIEKRNAKALPPPRETLPPEPALPDPNPPASAKEK